MPRPVLIIGEWNAICDRCGFRHKASALMDEWTGLKVCKECWEPRHPQDLIGNPRTESPPPWTRPEPTDGDASPTYISSSIGVQT
jgi:hypothetical protein